MVEFVFLFICRGMIGELLIALYYILCFSSISKQDISCALEIVIHGRSKNNDTKRNAPCIKTEMIRKDDQTELFFLLLPLDWDGSRSTQRTVWK